MGVPKTSDGKPIYLPNIFPGNVMLYIAGCGDSSTTIGAGSDFRASSDAAGTTDVEWQFRDWCYLAGGGLIYTGAEFNDTVTFKLSAPASTVTANGSNTGNVNLVEVVPNTGMSIIVPAAGNGTHDLTSGVPVPAYDEDNGEPADGWWNWSEPDTGSGTLTSAVSVTGKYDLYNFPIDLSVFMRKMPIMGSGNLDITVPAIKPKKILPQWKFTVSVVNGGHTGLKVGWYTVVARRKTV
jgi:hypothetical protein